MNDQDINYRAIRARVEARYGMRVGFFAHAISFVVAMVLGWVVFYNWFSSGWLFDLALIGSAGWFVGVTIHAVIWIMSELKERAIDREIEKERELLYRYGVKRKNSVGRYYELTDDGELAESDPYEDEDAPPVRLKR
jgi:uncharacterized membrane protein YciS (DUF1049 family)